MGFNSGFKVLNKTVTYLSNFSFTKIKHNRYTNCAYFGAWKVG